MKGWGEGTDPGGPYIGPLAFTVSERAVLSLLVLSESL